MSAIAELPWTALAFQGRTVCYCVDGDQLHARELGRREPLPITDEFRAAVAEDLARQARKAKE